MASLFNNNYSTIITKGLGAPACCALITASFGVNCGCSIEIIVPPPSGGGGPVPISGFYVPFPKNLEKCDRIVLVTVKITEKMVWRRQYIVDVCNADKMVKAINFANNIKDKLIIGVDQIKHISGRVTAIFTKSSDK